MERTFPGSRAQPSRPQIELAVNAGSDCWIGCTVLDHSGNANTPTQVTYQVDDLTDAVNVVPATSLGAQSSNSFEIHITAAQNVMFSCYRSSQINQVKITATLSDGTTVTRVTAYELIALATPQGN